MEAVPYITFLYMFQPNVPATYKELKLSEDGDNNPNQTFATHGSRYSALNVSKPRGYENTNLVEDKTQSNDDDVNNFNFWRFPKMDKVLYRASILSNFIYILVGVFGYLTFSESPQITFE